jgi:hypothetical protein
VPAFTACTSPNSTHGGPPPLNAGSCVSPTQTSTNVTVGSPDANGAGANSIGYLQLDVHAGVPGAPEDSDIVINTSITDVRCKAGVTACGAANSADGPDYTGQLRELLPLRLTDRNNNTVPGGGDIGDIPGTVSDTTFVFTFSCTATTSTTTIGSSCGVSTSANAVMGAGTVLDTKRAIWQLDTVTVHDGGPDGLISTPSGNTMFERQGVFVP